MRWTRTTTRRGSGTAWRLRSPRSTCSCRTSPSFARSTRERASPMVAATPTRPACSPLTAHRRRDRRRPRGVGDRSVRTPGDGGAASGRRGRRRRVRGLLQRRLHRGLGARGRGSRRTHALGRDRGRAGGRGDRRYGGQPTLAQPRPPLIHRATGGHQQDRTDQLVPSGGSDSGGTQAAVVVVTRAAVVVVVVGAPWSVISASVINCWSPMVARRAITRSPWRSA